MVQDLKTQQSNNVVLDLSALGDAANQSISGEQQEKPLLEKPIIATTESCTLRVMTNDLKSNREDPSKKYFNTSFTVETKFTHEDEEIKSFDRYGGLRFYPLMNPDGTVVMNNGQPVLERFWTADGSKDTASAFAKLLYKVQQYDDKVQTFQDFFNFMNEKHQVMIKTEFTSFGGKTTKKQIIQNFI